MLSILCWMKQTGYLKIQSWATSIRLENDFDLVYKKYEGKLNDLLCKNEQKQILELLP